MPRKKGLGQAVDKALNEMDQLKKDLKNFDDRICENLEKAISSSDLEDKDRDDLLKLINESSTAAHSLKINVAAIITKVKNLSPKVKGKSRFARDVVARFLEQPI